MCQDEVRGIAASLHNAFMRWDMGKRYVKLADLFAYHPEAPVLTVPHPATEALVGLHGDLKVALEGMTSEGLTIRWNDQITAKVDALTERVRQVLVDLEPLSDAHFRDGRHASNRPNILREQRGSRGDLYGTGVGYRDYHYAVEVCGPGEGHILHEPCGTELHLHEHFIELMRPDPDFYGQVWCPTCKLNAPIGQFAIAGLARAA
jgi:hypothetical protein